MISVKNHDRCLLLVILFVYGCKIKDNDCIWLFVLLIALFIN